MDPIRLPVEGPGGFRGALAHTAFRNIWFSQLAAQLADKFLLFSLIILAYQISGGSTSVAVTLLAPVVSRIDLYAPYWCAVVLLVIAGTLIFASEIPPLARHTESPVEESRSRFRLMLLDLKEGVDALRSSRGLRLAFGQVSIAVLVLFNLYALAPAYVSKVIGIAAQDTYVILGPATAGAILSAVLLGQFMSHIDRSRLLAGSLVANGVP